MFGWLTRFRRRPASRPVPDDLWQPVIDGHPFLSVLSATDQARLRELAGEFLARKEFTGAHGFVITDPVAVAVAAQAVLPVLHLASGLQWYDDFVGIVIHPADAVARREQTDEAGVVHRYDEVLSGEAMEGGPVMLNWQAVANAAGTASQGYNVVIHEFAHKIDMRDGIANGCPPLPSHFMGEPDATSARRRWQQVMQSEYERFREAVIVAERFGGAWPWLDAYGAESPAEFFAVACEAYFVNRTQFAQSFAALLPLFDAFFMPTAATGMAD
jgi:hypothetical protein